MITPDFNVDCPAVKTTSLGLEVSDSISLDEWTRLGQKLTQTDHRMNWWLGDWAAFGERQYGDLTEFARANRVDPHTLSNMARVSRNVEMSRRRDDLQWSYHEAVASLKPNEQIKWLKRAKDEGLKISNLRKEIRLSKGETLALVSDGDILKMLSKYHLDFKAELEKKEAAFWTKDRRLYWMKELEWYHEFAIKLEEMTDDD